MENYKKTFKQNNFVFNHSSVATPNWNLNVLYFSKIEVQQ